MLIRERPNFVYDVEIARGKKRTIRGATLVSVWCPCLSGEIREPSDQLWNNTAWAESWKEEGRGKSA